jgi:WD40 repeat protein
MFVSVAFSPDGQHIVSGSSDKLVKVWSVSSGKEVASLAGHAHCVRSVAFSPDGQHIVSGSSDNLVKVWS